MLRARAGLQESACASSSATPRKPSPWCGQITSRLPAHVDLWLDQDELSTGGAFPRAHRRGHRRTMRLRAGLRGRLGPAVGMGAARSGAGPGARARPAAPLPAAHPARAPAAAPARTGRAGRPPLPGGPGPQRTGGGRRRRSLVGTAVRAAQPGHRRHARRGPARPAAGLQPRPDGLQERRLPVAGNTGRQPAGAVPQPGGLSITCARRCRTTTRWPTG